MDTKGYEKSVIMNDGGFSRVDGRMAKTNFFGCEITAVSWTGLEEQISAWSQERCSKYIAICNVHSVTTSIWSPGLREAIENAAVATPDGMPLSLIMRRRGWFGQERINGPDLMLRLCRSPHKYKVYLYGSSSTVLAALLNKLAEVAPQVEIVGSESPPFRPLTDDEESLVVERIRSSGAELVFVGLGCPKQEIWMMKNSPKIPCVLIGVGAAFDYLSGTKSRSPLWMQKSGLEWLHRLATEPRRLARRYFTTNTVFLARYAPELMFAVANEIWSLSLRGISRNRRIGDSDDG